MWRNGTEKKHEYRNVFPQIFFSFLIVEDQSLWFKDFGLNESDSEMNALMLEKQEETSSYP